MSFIVRLLLALTGRTKGITCECCDEGDSCPDCS